MNPCKLGIKHTTIDPGVFQYSRENSNTKTLNLRPKTQSRERKTKGFANRCLKTTGFSFKTRRQLLASKGRRKKNRDQLCKSILGRLLEGTNFDPKYYPQAFTTQLRMLLLYSMSLVFCTKNFRYNLATTSDVRNRLADTKM